LAGDKLAKITYKGSMEANTYDLPSGNTYLLFKNLPTEIALKDVSWFIQKSDFEVKLSRIEKVKLGLAKPEEKKKRKVK
jgi:hypothetical protein